MSEIKKSRRGSCCVAVGCSIRAATNLLSQVKMFSFPTDPDRKKKWENAVKRENWVASRYSKICNRHFISGKPSSDPSSPDYLPSVFDHKRADAENQTQSLVRYDRGVKRRKTDISSLSLPSVADGTPSEEVDYSVPGKTDQATMTELSGDDLTKLESKLKGYEAQAIMLEEKAKKNTFSGSVMNDFKSFNFYTKFPSFALYFGILKLILDGWEPAAKTSLEHADQLLLVLCKLRLGLLNGDLAFRFSTSRCMVGKIFREWIHRMSVVLAFFISKPPKKVLRKRMPQCFVEANLKHITSIIDCTEIFIQRPFNLDTRALTYSNYKHHNTMKFLISITPCGAIEFVSSLYGGRISDKEITKLSGFLNTINPGDTVLADRGFNIAEAVALKGAEVILPASTRKKNQLSAKEVIESRKIARVRVHVERCIGRVKSYGILKTNWPISYFQHHQDDTCTGDNIITVLSALCNCTKGKILKN